MNVRVVNNFHTTLANAVTDTATTLSLATGSGNTLRTKLSGAPNVALPAGDWLYLTLVDASGNLEIVKVTALAATGDNVTVVRGVDGTTARSWLAGDGVSCRPCAALFADALTLVDTAANAYGFQPLDAKLTSLSGLSAVADRISYFTGADTMALTPLSAYARTLLDDADAATMRETLGLVASAYALTLLDDADAATARTTLGLATVSQAEAEAGTATVERSWTAERVKQAIQATQSGLGVNQTWQDVTSSRALGSTYTNSTGKPIFVIVTAGIHSFYYTSIYYITVKVSNVALAMANVSDVNSGGYTYASYSSISFIVLPGQTYSVTATDVDNTSATISGYANKWMELR